MWQSTAASRVSIRGWVRRTPLSSRHTATLVLRRRREPREQFFAPGALFRAAEAHEEGRRILCSPQFGDYIAVRDEPIERRDIRQREKNFAFREFYGMWAHCDV